MNSHPSSFRRTAAAAGLLGALVSAACEEGALEPETAPPTAEAPGGIPGPPPGVGGPPGFVILPRPVGPPPGVPAPPWAGPPGVARPVAQIELGNDFSCYLDTAGQAFCWGAGGGQLGTGGLESSTVPVPVAGGHVFRALALGDANACALDVDGFAWCWGLRGASGVLGNGENITMSAVPVAVAGGLRYTEIDAGLGHVCAVSTDGATFCWGNGSSGQLGQGSQARSNVPVEVLNSAALGLRNVRAGMFGTCAVTSTGTPYCWGQNRGHFSAETSPERLLVPTPVQAGARYAELQPGFFFGCGRADDGVVSCWGWDQYGGLGTGALPPPDPAGYHVPTPVNSGEPFASLEVFKNNRVLPVNCGLTPAGDALCWGVAAPVDGVTPGSLGETLPERCDFTGILTGLTGELACASSPTLVPGGLSFSDIAVGAGHMCGITTDGSVYCWGSNSMGQLGNGTTTDSSVPVRVLGPVA